MEKSLGRNVLVRHGVACPIPATVTWLHAAPNVMRNRISPPCAAQALVKLTLLNTTAWKQAL